MDYKILAYVLVGKLQAYSELLMHQSQTAYLLGHFMGTNICKVQDIITDIYDTKSSQVVFFLDFKKVFDSVDCTFLSLLLIRMKFPKTFITWIMLLYNGAVSNVQNNGWLSQDIKLFHGVRQGCPFSCLLFNLVSQVLIYYL